MTNDFFLASASAYANKHGYEAARTLGNIDSSDVHHITGIEFLSSGSWTTVTVSAFENETYP